MRYLRILCICVIQLFLSAVAFAQTQVTGHVADVRGEDIIGANVTVKGTSNGTITDIDGNFTINVDDKNGTLAVSFIGYKTKEVKIGEKARLQIVLEEDTETLDEVVVVGYGTQTKKSLTGAISDVKSDALTRSVSTTTAGALSGKIAGVSTRAVDARPGRGINLEIRNMGSPLFVIDGIPYGGMNSRDWLQASDVSGSDVFNALNIEDIESITVLKDASAAIYGLRASNGVVLVTTKKGKKNDGTLSGKSLDQLVQEYGLSSNLFRLRAVNDSRLIGKTIIDLDVRRKYGLNIIEVRRVDSSQHRFLKTITQKLASPDTTIWVGDVLYITGEVSNVNRFAEDFLMEMLDGHTTEEASKADKSLDFYDIGIAEIVLMPSSNIVNRTVKEAGFRDKFNVNVLGIRRKKEYILRELGRERMHSGDVLLVQGAWQDIARISREDSDWVVLGQPLAEAAKVTLDYKAPIAAAIMVLMVAMMVFDFIPVAPVTAVMIAGLLMVLTGCFRNVEAAYKTINWETIVLFAAMLPMSLALEKTGASEYISNSLVSGLGSYGPIVLMAGIYFTTSLMTMFISNTVTAVLMAPIALQSAVQIGVSPVPFLFAVTVAASMCFASPFSTPPNALVMPAGQYTFMDYIKVGLPLQIIMGVVMVFVLPLLFPF